VSKRAALLAHFVGAEGGFDALDNRESRAAAGPPVIRVRVSVLSHEPTPARFVFERCMPSEERLEGMEHRQDHATGRAEDARYLGDRCIEIGDMRDGQARDDEIEGGIG
jgi:hypothetical protein